MTNVVSIRRPAELACSACGSIAEASCDCGVPYVPAGQRAIEAIRANPQKSDRAIAAELGIGNKTVSRARNALVSDDTPDERVGRDGKSYPVRPRIVREIVEEFDPELALAQTKDAFIARAAQAQADAIYHGLIDVEIIEAAEEAANAWSGLVSKLKGKAQ